MGLPTLLAVLREDREDAELLRGALECLVAACSDVNDTSAAVASTSAPSGAPGSPPAVSSTAGLNAELVCRSPDHVTILLSILDDGGGGSGSGAGIGGGSRGGGDLYARYYTLQLLNALLAACPFRVQASAGTQAYMRRYMSCHALPRAYWSTDCRPSRRLTQRSSCH